MRNDVLGVGLRWDAPVLPERCGIPNRVMTYVTRLKPRLDGANTIAANAKARLACPQTKAGLSPFGWTYLL